MATSSPNTQTLSFHLDDLISENSAMKRCLALAREGAKSDLPILLQGETGTGKTLLAQAIHNSSPRSGNAFLSFNASAMSDTLLESQLFGHEKGAFTGATARMRGKFEAAHDGTLFFDEIADMSPLAQAKILRAVEYGEYERLGSEVMHYANVRIISATNRNVRTLSRQGHFREDLYHRLNGLTLTIPSLRERREDLPALIATELQLCAGHAGKNIVAIDPDAFTKLLTYSWPGNLRELHRVIQAIVLFSESDTITSEDVVLDEEVDTWDAPAPYPQSHPRQPYYPSAQGGHSMAAPPGYQAPNQPMTHLPQPPPPEAGGSTSDLSLETALLKHVQFVYQISGLNKRRTAKLLGISRSTLDRKLEALGQESNGGE